VPDFILPTLHPAQRVVAESQARYRVLACGRRFGKTVLGAAVAAQCAARGGRVFWLAPVYRQAEEGFGLVRSLALQMPESQIREAALTIDFPSSGGSIEARSADDPSRLRGSGLDLAVFDEARLIDSQAWHEVVRPALLDRRGKALFFSTPGGRDWFYGLFERGQGVDPDWRSWRFSTHDNPHIEGKELDELRQQMPERVYRQEILAEFLADGTGVFRGVRAASTVEPKRRDEGASYVSFYDVARTNDFNAVATFRCGPKLQQVQCDRWSGTTWETTKARLSRLRDYYGALYVDTTTQEYSEPLVRELQEVLGRRVQVQGFRFTNQNKARMTDTFALLLEQGQIELLNPEKCDGEIRAAVENQISELEAWTATRLPSGMTRYAAPGNEHDDVAVACLAAAMLAKEEAPPTPEQWAHLQRMLGGGPASWM
jgi:hypothetical protein